MDLFTSILLLLSRELAYFNPSFRAWVITEKFPTGLGVWVTCEFKAQPFNTQFTEELVQYPCENFKKKENENGTKLMISHKFHTNYIS